MRKPSAAPQRTVTDDRVTDHQPAVGALGPSLTSDAPPVNAEPSHDNAPSSDGEPKRTRRRRSPEERARFLREQLQKAEAKAETVSPSSEGLPVEVIASTLTHLDATISHVADVAPVDAEYLAGMAASLKPIIDFYSAREPTVATLWAVAGVSLLSYAAIKVVAIRARQAEKGSSNAATKA